MDTFSHDNSYHKSEGGGWKMLITIITFYQLKITRKHKERCFLPNKWPKPLKYTQHHGDFWFCGFVFGPFINIFCYRKRKEGGRGLSREKMSEFMNGPLIAVSNHKIVSYSSPLQSQNYWIWTYHTSTNTVYNNSFYEIHAYKTMGPIHWLVINWNVLHIKPQKILYDGIYKLKTTLL